MSSFLKTYKEMQNNLFLSFTKVKVNDIIIVVHPLYAVVEI